LGQLLAQWPGFLQRKQVSEVTSLGAEHSLAQWPGFLHRKQTSLPNAYEYSLADSTDLFKKSPLVLTLEFILAGWEGVSEGCIMTLELHRLHSQNIPWLTGADYCSMLPFDMILLSLSSSSSDSSDSSDTFDTTLGGAGIFSTLIGFGFFSSSTLGSST
jgi:hypothetical protein